jgi:hypothetical protein
MSERGRGYQVPCELTCILYRSELYAPPDHVDDLLPHDLWTSLPIYLETLSSCHTVHLRWTPDRAGVMRRSLERTITEKCKP